VNSRAAAGTSGMDHSKANRGESSATNVSAGNDTQAEGKKKAKRSPVIDVAAVDIYSSNALPSFVSIVSRLVTTQRIATFSQHLNLSSFCMVSLTRS
jgi:hypothetical protein